MKQVAWTSLLTISLSGAFFATPSLQSQSTIALRGNIAGIPAAGLPEGVNVAVASLGSSAVNTDGTFEIRDVPAGRRDLTLRLVRPGISFLSGQTGRTILSTKVVSVDNQDIANIQLQWLPLASIATELLEVDRDGKVISKLTSDDALLRIKSPSGQAIDGACDFSLCVRSEVTVLLSPSRAPVFQHLLPPGAYTLQAERLPVGYSIKAINVESTDVRGKTLEIDSNTSSVKIEVLLLKNP